MDGPQRFYAAHAAAIEATPPQSHPRRYPFVTCSGIAVALAWVTLQAWVVSASWPAGCVWNDRSHCPHPITSVAGAVLATSPPLVLGISTAVLGWGRARSLAGRRLQAAGLVAAGLCTAGFAALMLYTVAGWWWGMWTVGWITAGMGAATITAAWRFLRRARPPSSGPSSSGPRAPGCGSGTCSGP